MKEMILASSQAKILLSQSDNQEIRTFLKNIGSNFILKDKTFRFEGQKGWRALAEGEPTETFSNWRNIRVWNYAGVSYSRSFKVKMRQVRHRTPICAVSHFIGGHQSKWDKIGHYKKGVSHTYKLDK